MELKYTPDGVPALHVEDTTQGPIVRPLIEIHGDTPVFGDPILAQGPLYYKPPSQVIKDNIGRHRRELAAVKGRLDTAIVETSRKELALNQLQRDIDTNQRKLDEFPATSRLLDFVDRKITHIVRFSGGYGAGDIHQSTLEAAPSTFPNDVPTVTAFNSNGDRLYIPLLTLFGDSKGDLAWYISDPAGERPWRKVIPCLSEEEAIDICVQELQKRVDACGNASEPVRPTQFLVDQAHKYGIPVPDTIYTALREKREKELNREIQTAEENLKHLHRKKKEALEQY